MRQHYSFEKDLLELFGLGNRMVKTFELRCSVNEHPTLTCEFYLEENGFPVVDPESSELVTLRRKYDVLLKEKGNGQKGCTKKGR